MLLGSYVINQHNPELLITLRALEKIWHSGAALGDPEAFYRFFDGGKTLEKIGLLKTSWDPEFYFYDDENFYITKITHNNQPHQAVLMNVLTGNVTYLHLPESGCNFWAINASIGFFGYTSASFRGWFSDMERYK